MSQFAINSSTNFNASNYMVGSGSELDKEAFLLLLVTQFQYQDPLSPSEDTEFVAQLAQFTSLEQMMNLNTTMESLVATIDSQMVIQTASLIGLDVAARGTGISLTDGVASQIAYASDVDIASAVANIYDSSGNLVASVAMSPSTAGVNHFTWDGKDSDGNTCANGVYTFALSATDANGDWVLTDTQVSGTVNAVSNYSGEVLMRLSDGRVVSLSEVYEIYGQTEATEEEEEVDPDFESLFPSDDDEDEDDTDVDGTDTDTDAGTDGTDTDTDGTDTDGSDSSDGDDSDSSAFSLFSSLFNK